MTAAVILAGGRSSRMGQDKALIAVGTEPLIQRTCRVALACADPVYVVAPWPDRYRPLVPSAVHWIEERASPERPEASQGPLGALVLALGLLRDRPQCPEWVLVLACDMPNLSAAALNSWRADLATVPLPYLAYLPRRQHRWEPLCGFYRTAALEPLRQYVTAPLAASKEPAQGSKVGPRGRSLQAWLRQHPVQPMPQVEDAMLANLNTPADLEAWQRSSQSDS
ncbi:molybdenum cofactor guanylyltransferase [Nodosilinea nodulosa]|uniref:molybdenum cofactor guanylyltransferase n=1 Tax=Nodosilinea nodulosa TaxID=416001 RepID=UPI0002E5A2A9|nr:molybdenum cofactor guanylyltransferase [Nodosilinea nodulosa]